MSSSLLESTYDDLPYGSRAFKETHPGRLAAVARLLGLKPPDVATCRILELGCAEGGNLIPMAASLPEAKLVGIDLSGRQVETGKRRVKEAGLTNVELLHLDIADADASLGEFDFVMAHGVFSWVPPEVADKILGLCGALLTPNGIAYVSYNTYPGWHQRGMVREILKWHVRGTRSPEVQVASARGFLEFLRRSARDRTETYRKILTDEQEWTKELEDGHFFHETLEPFNEPCYFHEFAARAGRHGLAYLGESNLAANLLGPMRPELDEFLSQFTSDRLEKEQYADFMRNRKFRQSLLCRAGLPVRSELDPSAVRDLLFLCRARLEGEGLDLSPGVEVTFTTVDKKSLKTADPAAKAMVAVLLSAWPRALSLPELLDAAASALGRAGGLDSAHEESLVKGLLRAVADDVVDPVTWRAPFVRAPGARPAASPSARVLAKESDLVTNLWHYQVEMDDLGRILLTLLDGSRDRAALLDDLAALVVKDGLLQDGTGLPVRDPQVVKQLAGPNMEAILGRLAKNAFLVA